MDPSIGSPAYNKTGKSPPQPKEKNIHKRNSKGETELHLACMRQDVAQVKALIKSGIDVNCPDFAGWTALHEAAGTGDRGVVELLLTAGAQVNARSINGDTPLHDAAATGSCEVVKVLLQNGANPQDKNVGGLTALEVAESSKMRELLLSFQSSTASGNTIIQLETLETGASVQEPHSSAVPPICENPTAPRQRAPTALALLLSELQEKLTRLGGHSEAERQDTEERCSALWDIHATLNQAFFHQHIEKNNLALKFWSVPNHLRRKIVKSQLVSLASAQAQLIDVIQRQMLNVQELETLCSKHGSCPSLTSAQAPAQALTTAQTPAQALTTAQGSKALTAAQAPAQGTKALTAAQGSKALSAAQGTKALTTAQGSKALTIAQGSKALSAAQGSKALTTAQGNKALTIAQGSKALTAAQGNKALTAAQGNKALTAAQGSKCLTAAKNVSLQNNKAGQTPTSSSSTWKERRPGGLQVQSLGPGATQSCDVEQRASVEGPGSPSLLDSASEVVVDGLALLMNIAVVHVVRDDELVPNALMDQRWEQLLKEDSWSF